MSMAKRVRART